jgi:hypothetical protein
MPAQAIIPKRLDPDSPEWKANEPKKWRLSTVNTNDMKDMKCINGVKRVYGTVAFFLFPIPLALFHQLCER